MAPRLPEQVARPHGCRHCDDPGTCGRGEGFHNRIFQEFRNAAFYPPDAGQSYIGHVYLDQFARECHDQHRLIRMRFNCYPNELLLPLCAPYELLDGSWRGVDKVIITSEVRKPTLRYREDQRV